MPSSNDIPIKKRFGQHFLRDKNLVLKAIDRVTIDSTTSIFEIGCGDGFLTREILQTNMARLWVFEIDPDWATYVRKEFGSDERLTVFEENILDVDFTTLKEHAPWTLLANIPYQITFPILHMLHRNRELLREGVIMMQEEVAQKVMKTQGRGYGYPSLFFQHYFHLELMDKVPPSAFYPPPKVFSRLMYLKPKAKVPVIPEEDHFWKFIKMCFRQPRRTLRNNLLQTHFEFSTISEKLLSLRSQQMSMENFLQLWNQLRVTKSS